MTHVQLDHELPDPINYEVHLLYAICTTAATTDDPPFKALFAAYDSIFAEEEVEHEHDGLVFRYLMRLGEQARASIRKGTWQGYVHALRELLKTKDITLVSDRTESEEGEETSVGDYALEINGGHAQDNGYLSKPPKRRRLSFNDSHLDETWLSQQSRPEDTSPPTPAGPGHLARPNKRGQQPSNGRRARSTEGRPSGVRFAEPERVPSPSHQISAHQRAGVPPSAYQPPSEDLEARAEAFYNTCDHRIARHFLERWITTTKLSQQRSDEAYEYAAQHDRGILLGSALSQLAECARHLWQIRKVKQQHEQWEIQADRQYIRRLLARALTHWLAAARQGQLDLKKAKQWMMQLKYFRKWKQLALGNEIKTRSIVTRRVLRMWSERADRKRLYVAQVDAVYEERIARQCFKTWMWQYVSRRLEHTRPLNIMRKAFSTWRNRVATITANARVAEDRVRVKDKRETLDNLRRSLAKRQHLHGVAERQHATNLKTRYLATLVAQGRLTPVATVVSLQSRLDLERRAFGAWTVQLRLSRQAADVNKRRRLQAAWTQWNDALRCQALSQHINERVVLENLYRWVLQERLQLFVRTRDARLVQWALMYWRGRQQELQWQLNQSLLRYQQGEERRIMSAGMVHLNSALRRHEDAERAAVEFANLRRLPGVLDVWRAKADHAVVLAQKGQRARYYLLGTKTLRAWKQKANEHKHDRRRDAYTQIRSRIKVRIVGHSLNRWREKNAQLQSMDETATYANLRRDSTAKANMLQEWRDRLSHVHQLSNQATILDQEKLLAGSLSALRVSHTYIETLEARSHSFLHDTEIAILASALRRLQWSTFTAARRVESAEALRFRNRDLHVREWLRLWAAKAVAKHQPPPATVGQVEDPESPSLRPASRAAARSSSRDRFTSPVRRGEAGGTTPEHTRTPSRSRRIGRFRQLLPTPAGLTPMAFEPAYLSTTPAPLQSQPVFTVRPPAMPTEGLTPQITPFARKLRAGGITPQPIPTSVLKRGSLFGRSTGLGTGKSVRFVGGRFQKASGLGDVTGGEEAVKIEIDRAEGDMGT